MGRKIVIAFYLLLSVFITFNISAWHNNSLLAWDKGGYYIYLPATLIYNDLGNLDFIQHVDRIYHPNGDTKAYAIYTHPQTGRRYTKYPMGVAICELPLFAVVHVVNRVFGIAPADGYSWPYQLSIALSTIVFSVLGLLLLNKFLSQYFSPRAVLWTLLLLAFGTNLYSYTAFDQGMSHNFSFFFFAALMYLADAFIKQGKTKHALLLGLVAGMIIITRPVNVVVLVVPLVWLAVNGKSVLNRKNTVPALLLSVLLAAAVLLVQMSYWKYTTGSWIHYSYEGERFYFSRPHIGEGLFSYRKGWFVYTPVALPGIACIALLWKRHRHFFWSLAVFFSVNIYVVFCWHDWSYGGSFGCRPLIESLALLGIPLCALTERVNRAGKWARLLFYTIACLLIGLNIFQTYQFHHSVIDCCNMNRAYYWQVFGKPEISPEDWKLLNN